MGFPHFEVAGGVVDGVNTIFTTSVPYTPGTLAVFLNGQLKRKDFSDGWAETSPAAGTFTMDVAPSDLFLPPDVVQVFFLDASTGPVVEEVCPIQGVILAVDDLTGVFADVQNLSGSIEVCT